MFTIENNRQHIIRDLYPLCRIQELWAVELTSSQSVLEDLLETQELQNTEIDGRVESQSSLVWSKSAVELHTVSAVDLDLVLVIVPDDTELDDSFWDGNDLEGGTVFWVLLEKGGVLEGWGKLWRNFC